jgi:hypothetical protein
MPRPALALNLIATRFLKLFFSLHTPAYPEWAGTPYKISNLFKMLAENACREMASRAARMLLADRISIVEKNTIKTIWTSCTLSYRIENVVIANLWIVNDG